MKYSDTTLAAYERLQWPPEYHRFYVSPRYSPGSPALVDCRTASRVAADELEFYYEHALSGLEGPAAQERARKLGLRGIIEAQRDRSEGIQVYDVLMNETFWRGRIATRDLKPGDRIADSDLANLPPGLVVKNATRESAVFTTVLDESGFWHYPPARHHIRVERRIQSRA